MKTKPDQRHKNKEITKTSPLVISGITAPKNIKEAKRILSKLISAFIKGDIEDQKAKTLCYLLNSFVMIIRDNDFENRLQLLETNMKGEK
ncbi:hypothetical protein [Clostridium sp.]|uniref:hypothetical protein n=1 Tax=Clostridium sp. TaxID=1506 RepID=UPI002844447D|nr:hypothetical protein [Clostridium sp.]MDR3596494.1 hypothetical protein [Clostridium sp.]